MNLKPHAPETNALPLFWPVVEINLFEIGSYVINEEMVFKIGPTLLVNQARSQEFPIRGGLFWRVETTSNYLDPDFDRSSIRLSRFLSPNLRDPPKKRSSARLKPSFSGQNHIRPLTNSHRQANGGAIFVFGAKIGLKSAKNGVFCILFRPMGGLI